MLSAHKDEAVPDTLILCMDFEKNLPPPVTNIGVEYYKQQLWIHNFGILNVRTGDASMYLYSEHSAAKGSNEVISMLPYKEEALELQKAASLRGQLFGQNKNRFLFIIPTT